MSDDLDEYFKRCFAGVDMKKLVGMDITAPMFSDRWARQMAEMRAEEAKADAVLAAMAEANKEETTDE